MVAITSTARAAAPARLLLAAGALAGPLYIGIGALEALTRAGFDIRVHSLSLLANGPVGWIHSTMMILTGTLAMLGALGLRRASGMDVSKWTVRGIALFGLGVAVSGVFRAAPSYGFPIGTPDGPPTAMTVHGMGHLIAGSIGFLGLIAACLVQARLFAVGKDTGWAVFSAVTGVIYLVTFAGIASGAGNTAINLGFTFAVILGWVWATALTLRARTEAAS